MSNVVVTLLSTHSRKPALTGSTTPLRRQTSTKICLSGQSRVWQTDTASLRQGRQWSSTLIWLSAVLFGGGLLWGLVGRVDQTVSARGRLVPAGNVREVDVPSTGVVEKVLVNEGQNVSAGQPLLRISQLV